MGIYMGPVIEKVGNLVLSMVSELDFVKDPLMVLSFRLAALKIMMMCAVLLMVGYLDSLLVQCFVTLID